jgi:hypothetical protein
MADIEMTTDDTLELDTIIEFSSRAKKPINVTEGSDYNITGFQTHTGVFDPESSGDYTIEVNGQELSIKVRDNNRPKTLDFEDQTVGSGVPQGWKNINTGGASVSVTSSTSYSGSKSIKFDGQITQNRSISPTESYGKYQPLTESISFAVKKTGEQGGGANIGIGVYSGGASSGTEHIRVQLRNGLQHYPNNSRSTLTSNVNSDEWVFVTIKDINTSSDTYSVIWQKNSGNGQKNTFNMINPISSSGYDDIRVGAYESTGYVDYIKFG